MRKVFTDELPHKGIQVNWIKSVGYEVKFIYDDIKGEVEIVDYFKKNNKNYLKIKYNNSELDIIPEHFSQCRLGDILNIKTKKYKYKIGDIIINLNSGKIQVLRQIRIKNKKSSVKGYEYKCLICGNEDTISENNINKKEGCNVCSNKKILKGYNDMWTTNPELASLLADPNDGYKYTEHSNKQLNWKCPSCSNIIKNKQISKINRQGLSCPKCGDGISYPEKFMYNILQQLEIEFIYQLSKTTFKWCNEYKYDFYIPKYNIIIETHGMGHYEIGFQTIVKSKRARTLEQEQENDRLKKELALKNGIKEDNYIIIDCRYSILNWIKNHISKSELNNIFDLSKINWLECHRYACSSLVKKVCDLWNNGIHNITKISEIMKLCNNTIIKYLQQGKELELCNYDKKYTTNIGSSKKVICLNNNKIFKTIKQAGIYMKLKSYSIISACCRGKLKSAGKDPITGKKLRWMYYDDYLKNK